MSVLTISDSFCIGVLDLAAATAWYKEKVGLQKLPLKIDDQERCIALGFSKNDQTGRVLKLRWSLPKSHNRILHLRNSNPLLGTFLCSLGQRLFLLLNPSFNHSSDAIIVAYLMKLSQSRNLSLHLRYCIEGKHGGNYPKKGKRYTSLIRGFSVSALR